MDIVFYNTNEPKNKLVKNLGTGTTISGQLYGQTDIMAPVIKLIGTDALNYNYAYISDFGRYYYYEKPCDVEGNITFVHLHADSVFNFANDIKNSEGLIRRANKGDSYIRDELVTKLTKVNYEVKRLGSPLTINPNYVLVIGGVNNVSNV